MKMNRLPTPKKQTQNKAICCLFFPLSTFAAPGYLYILYAKSCTNNQRISLFLYIFLKQKIGFMTPLETRMSCKWPLRRYKFIVQEFVIIAKIGNVVKKVPPKAVNLTFFYFNFKYIRVSQMKSIQSINKILFRMIRGP